MKLKLLTLLLVAILAINTSCTTCSEEAERKRSSEVEQIHKIELLNCNGEVVREWRVKGNYIGSRSYSNIFEFWDETTQKPVVVTGTVVITKIN